MRCVLAACLAALSTVVAAQIPKYPCFPLVISYEAEGAGNVKQTADDLFQYTDGIMPQAYYYPPNVDLASSIQEGVHNISQALADTFDACSSVQIVLMGDGLGAAYITAALGGATIGDLVIPGLSWNEAQNITAVVLFRNPLSDPSVGDQAACPACMEASIRSASRLQTSNMGIDGRVQSLASTGPYRTSLADYDNRTQNWCIAGDANCCGGATTTTLNSTSYFSNVQELTAVQFVLEQLGPLFPVPTTTVVPMSTNACTLPPAAGTSSTSIIPASASGHASHTSMSYPTIPTPSTSTASAASQAPSASATKSATGGSNAVSPAAEGLVISALISVVAMVLTL